MIRNMVKHNDDIDYIADTMDMTVDELREFIATNIPDMAID